MMYFLGKCIDYNATTFYPWLPFSGNKNISTIYEHYPIFVDWSENSELQSINQDKR